MPKVTLTDLTSLTNQTSAITIINQNMDDIVTALENTLSRDGTSPNEMEADFDMNDNRILNLPAPLTETEPLRLADVDLTVNGALYLSGSSVTSNSVGTGSKTWVTQTGRLFTAGQYVTITTGSSSPMMYGQVTSYTSGSLTVNVIFSVGSGTYTSWSIFISGAPSQLSTLIDGDYGDLTVASNIFSIDSNVLSSFGRTLIDDANAGAARTTLGAVGTSDLGTNVGTFLATPSSANLAAALTDETGTGAAVFATSPTLVTPILGTPTSGTLTNCTGLPVSSGISGLGTNVATFLATPSSANLAAALTDETGTGAAVFATSPTLVTPILGTPTSGTLTNCTGLPTAGLVANAVTNAKLAQVATATFKGRTTAGTGDVEDLTATQATALLNAMVGDSGSGGTKGLVPAPVTGDALKFLRGDGTFAAIPGGGDALTTNPLSQFAATTSAQLAGVISDETGSGALVFATSPTLVTPALGTPSSGTLTNCTGLPVSGIAASTSTALGVGSIELGHASDTTISRTSAGVAAIEGSRISTAMIGEIKIWPTGTVPANCLECDGSAVSRTTYAALFAVIGETHGEGDNSTTFNLPDYRGEFLRGWDHGASRDPDKASRTAPNTGGATGDNVGSKQTSQYAAHTHGPGSGSQFRNFSSGESNSLSTTTGGNNGLSTVTASSGGNETRPRNVNVMYVIVYQ